MKRFREAEQMNRTMNDQQDCEGPDHTLLRRTHERCPTLIAAYWPAQPRVTVRAGEISRSDADFFPPGAYRGSRTRESRVVCGHGHHRSVASGMLLIETCCSTIFFPSTTCRTPWP